MSKILLVEDDQFFRETVRDLLKKKKYDVAEAPNGKVAREILAVQDFDMVLSDIQMPEVTGIDLLGWCKAHKPTMPVVLMTGFSMLLETQSAFDLGARDFITKPFRNVELIQLIEKIVGKTNVPQESLPASEYCKVAMSEFVARPRVEFDVYIRLSETKFLKIANHGDELDRGRLEQYAAKGVKYLYILSADFRKLIALNLNIGKIIKDRTDIAKEKKINFMKYTGEVILEKAFVDGVNKELFSEAETYLNIAVDVMTEEDSYMDLLTLLNSHSDQVYAHSLGVTMYAIMMAKLMGFESNFALSKLSMSSLFHDIGKKEVAREILEKPRYLLSIAERQIYESHALRSKELLIELKNVSDDVVQIVYEHHEDHTGQGYPLGKLKKHLHPLSRIVHCANLFVEQVLTGPNHEAQSAPVAVKYLESVHGDRIDPASLKALKKLFNLA